jgi:hypothetical protein
MIFHIQFQEKWDGARSAIELWKHTKMTETELSVTNVGSHMWKMNHENSDTDLFQIYVADTKQILRGEFDFIHSSSETNNGKTGKYKVEIVRHEIGKVISELLDGNVNFLWGVMSPIIINELGYTSVKVNNTIHLVDKPRCLEDNPLFTYGSYLGDLKRIVIANPCKGCYNSIRGLAIANKKKYINDSNIDLTIKKKKTKIILRTLRFGINYLKGHGFLFDRPPEGNFDMELINPWIMELDNAYKSSLYPEKPNEKMFRDFLYYVRMVGLE